MTLCPITLLYFVNLKLKKKKKLTIKPCQKEEEGEQIIYAIYFRILELDCQKMHPSFLDITETKITKVPREEQNRFHVPVTMRSVLWRSLWLCRKTTEESGSGIRVLVMAWRRTGRRHESFGKHNRESIRSDLTVKTVTSLLGHHLEVVGTVMMKLKTTATNDMAIVVVVAIVTTTKVVVSLPVVQDQRRHFLDVDELVRRFVAVERCLRLLCRFSCFLLR